MDDIIDKLKESGKGKEGTAEEPIEQKSIKESSIERSIGMAATKIAADIGANCIISVEKKEKEQYEENHFLDVKVSIFKKIKKEVYNKLEYETKVHKVSPGSIVPIKEVLMEAVNKKFIEKGDKVVCVEDESMGTGYKALIFIFDVDKIFFDMSVHKLTENIDPHVLENVINIALEIGKEGREGNSIGTAFVVGDKSKTLKYVKQLVINPFVGYDDDRKNIGDPDIRETVKEFSQLDGVFIIDEKGVIVTAGAYLSVDPGELKLKGLGTRHTACAAITEKTDAIAIVVSKSGGIIRVFKEGKIVMKLP